MQVLNNVISHSEPHHNVNSTDKNCETAIHSNTQYFSQRCEYKRALLNFTHSNYSSFSIAKLSCYMQALSFIVAISHALRQNLTDFRPFLSLTPWGSFLTENETVSLSVATCNSFRQNGILPRWFKWSGCYSHLHNRCREREPVFSGKQLLSNYYCHNTTVHEGNWLRNRPRVALVLLPPKSAQNRQEVMFIGGKQNWPERT